MEIHPGNFFKSSPRFILWIILISYVEMEAMMKYMTVKIFNRNELIGVVKNSINYPK